MEYNDIYDEPQGSVLRGAIGAVIGALLGAVVWALVGMLGYIASVVGFVIAFLASKGYDLLKGRPGAPKLVILIICVILAVIVGNLGLAAYQVHQVYVEEGYAAYVTESKFFELMFPVLFEDGDFIGALAKDSAMGLLFAVLGCFGLLKQTVSKKKPEPAPAQPEQQDSFESAVRPDNHLE